MSHRNIILMVNAFELPDQSIPREDYALALNHLNATWPERVAQLPLETCLLREFLHKVSLACLSVVCGARELCLPVGACCCVGGALCTRVLACEWWPAQTCQSVCCSVAGAMHTCAGMLLSE